jgi:hypothetical protein
MTMSRVTRIDIHFTTKSGVERVATIMLQVEPGSQVKRIFLDRKGPGDQFPDPKPDAITLDDGPELKVGDGPEVCYMIDTGVVCW